MKQLSLWLGFLSCAMLAVLLPESCTKENGILDQKTLSKTSALGVEKTSTITPPANPAIAYLVQPKPNSSNNLMVMNADGSNQTAIITGVGPAVWSPAKDSSLLLFERTINQQTSLWLIDVSVINGKPIGSNLRQIPISLPTSRLNGERWSTLGDSIVFVTEETKIYTVSSAGGAPRLVYAPATTGFGDFDPDWSPDGSKISFDEWNDAWTQSSLKVLDITTGAITTVVPFGPYLIYTPEWSRHGDRIAYEAGGTIYTVAPASNATPTKVTSGSSPATWSPDDSKLAFVGGRTASVMTYTFSSGATQTLATGNWPDWKK